VDALHDGVFKNERQRTVVLVGLAVSCVVVVAAIVGLVVGVIVSAVAVLVTQVSFGENWDQFGMLVMIGAAILSLGIILGFILMLGLDGVMKNTPSTSERLDTHP